VRWGVNAILCGCQIVSTPAYKISNESLFALMLVDSRLSFLPVMCNMYVPESMISVKMADSHCLMSPYVAFCMKWLFTVYLPPRRPEEGGGGGGRHTDKKEKKFLVYKEIQKVLFAKSYTV
jgi:hypothetical protein